MSQLEPDALMCSARHGDVDAVVDYVSREAKLAFQAALPITE